MISDFFYQIANLKSTTRSGWKHKLHLADSESVADHTYMMSVMAMVLSDIKSMNTEKILKMCILHDWAESIIGDYMPNQITSEEKTKLEESAMEEILSFLPDNLKKEYSVIWNEYNDNLSSESTFVHELDKLEMALQAKIYEKDVGSKEIIPFINSVIGQIKDDDLKKLLTEIIQ